MRFGAVLQHRLYVVNDELRFLLRVVEREAAYLSVCAAGTAQNSFVVQVERVENLFA